MIQFGYLNINEDKYEIILVLADWDAKVCMDAPSTFHMRESYALKSQIHDPDTPTFMEALSGKHMNEYYNAMDEEINSLIRMDTWEIFPSK